MSGEFFDTNIIAYADDRSDEHKQLIAVELLQRSTEKRSRFVSTQVLQEYFVTATRKLGVSAESARRKVDLLSAFNLVLISRELVLGAIDIHRLHAISFWDALILRAAQAARCERVYSEDLQHGWVVDGLRIINPFLE